MDVDNLIAIDMHTHLEVSCRNPFDSYGGEYDRAADKYFRSSKRPTMDETVAYCRDKRIGFANVTVDARAQLDRRRIPNEEIVDAAGANPDIMIAFGSVDPRKGRFGARVQSCSPRRRRSTGQRSPTRARSTSAPCPHTAQPSSMRSTPARRRACGCPTKGR